MANTNTEPAALHFAIRNLVAAQRNAREGLLRPASDRELFIELARLNAETAIRSFDVLLPTKSVASPPITTANEHPNKNHSSCNLLGSANGTPPNWFQRVVALFRRKSSRLPNQ